MVKKKGTKIRISKDSLKKWYKVGMVLLVLFIIGYAIYLLIDNYRQVRLNQAINEMNLYCNTTWQDYINTEVVGLMTEYITNDCNCFYQNIYTMDKLASMCLCSCDLYDLNGTLITDDFRPLFSAIK